MIEVRAYGPIIIGLVVFITFLFIEFVVEFAIKASILAILCFVIYYLYSNRKYIVAKIKLFWTRYLYEYNKL